MGKFVEAPTPINQIWESAFDPVTLRIAAEEQGDQRRYPADLAGTVPQALSRLARIEATPELLKVTINPGRLSWEDPLTPGASEFIGYGGDRHRGVLLGETEVGHVDAR